jgi:hypothetical protein
MWPVCINLPAKLTHCALFPMAVRICLSTSARSFTDYLHLASPSKQRGMEIEIGGHSDIGNPAEPIALCGGADYGMEAQAPALFQLQKEG